MIEIFLYVIIALSLFIFYLHFKELDFSGITSLCVAVACILILIYRSSKNIDTTEFGSAESFGQFGDYVGGLLNPVFGFFTVWLLVRSLKYQNKDFELTKRTATSESIQKLIATLEIDFEKYLDLKFIKVGLGEYSLKNGVTKHFNGLPVKPSGKLEVFSQVRKLMIKIGEVKLRVKDESATSKDHNFLISNQIVQLNHIRTLAYEIISLYMEFINKDEIETINKIRFQHLDRFLDRLLCVGIIDFAEYTNLLDRKVDIIYRQSERVIQFERINFKSVPLPEI